MRYPTLMLLAALAFAACKNDPAATAAAEGQAAQDSAAQAAAAEPKSTVTCHFYAVGRDTTTVHLTQFPNGQAAGEMNWTPYEKDGATGSLQCKPQDGKLVCIWGMTIEGSQQAEEVHFAFEGENLVQYVYELKESGGVMRPKDASKPLRTEKFGTMACK